MLSLPGIKGFIKVKESKARGCPKLSIDETLAMRSEDFESFLKNICRIADLELLSIVEVSESHGNRVLLASPASTCEFLLPEICPDLPLGNLIVSNQVRTGYNKVFSGDEIFPVAGIWPDFVSPASSLAFVFLPLRDYTGILPSQNRWLDPRRRFTLATSSVLEPEEMLQPVLLATGLICLMLVSQQSNLLKKALELLPKGMPGVEAAFLTDQTAKITSILGWNLDSDPSEIESNLQPFIAEAISKIGKGAQSTSGYKSDRTVNVTLLDQDGSGSTYLVIIEKLRKQESKEAIDSTLMRFMSSVAHEIRNPLTGIAAGVQYLARKLPPDLAEADTLAFILDEINRLNRMVEDLYRIARPPELTITEVNLQQVISRSLLSLSDLILKRQIKVSQNLPDKLPVIMGDQDRIQQVLVNIIKNAIEASPERGLITIGIGVSDNWLTISIKDQGKGIPEELSERVFEPFYSTKQGGTGLGLCISKRFIEQHGGRLLYRNLDQGGAELIIYLPIREYKDGKHSGS